MFGATTNNATHELLRRFILSSTTNVNTLLPLLNHVQANSTSSTINLPNDSHFDPIDSHIDLQSNTCDKCPYKGDSDGVITHKKGHNMPKGMNFIFALCSFNEAFFFFKFVECKKNFFSLLNSSSLYKRY